MKSVWAVTIEMLDAPSKEEFMKVLADSRHGKPHNGTPAIAGRHKICKMMWCLAEAVRDIKREHVRQPIAYISIKTLVSSFSWFVLRQSQIRWR